MKPNKSKSKSRLAAEAKAVTQPNTTTTAPPVPDPEAFLEKAKQEPKRILLSDHIKTINTLRDEKKFTFREIAAWLSEHGIQTDHSAVYRAYLAAIPEDERNPEQDWSDVAKPD